MSKKFKIQVLVNVAVNGIYTSADHIIVLEAQTNMHDCKRSGETYPPWPGFLYATIAGPPPAPAIARPPARKMALPQTWKWKRASSDLWNKKKKGLHSAGTIPLKSPKLPPTLRPPPRWCRMPHAHRLPNDFLPGLWPAQNQGIGWLRQRMSCHIDRLRCKSNSFIQPLFWNDPGSLPPGQHRNSDLLDSKWHWKHVYICISTCIYVYTNI